MKDRFDGRAKRVLFAMFASAACSVMLGGCGILFQNHEKRADAQLKPTPGNAAKNVSR